MDDLNGADCDAGPYFNPYSKCRFEPGAYFSDEAINRGVFKCTGWTCPGRLSASVGHTDSMLVRL
jgi:hypothetical protein